MFSAAEPSYSPCDTTSCILSSGSSLSVTDQEMSKGPSTLFTGEDAWLPKERAIYSLEYVIATSAWVTDTYRDSPE